MSHRLPDGNRVDGYEMTGTRGYKDGDAETKRIKYKPPLKANPGNVVRVGGMTAGAKDDMPHASHGGRSGTVLPDGSIKRKDGTIYTGPSAPNPGNVIKASVGGGKMGCPLAHKTEAPFPESLVEPFVLCFCPPTCCLACGAVLEYVYDETHTRPVSRMSGADPVPPMECKSPILRQVLRESVVGSEPTDEQGVYTNVEGLRSSLSSRPPERREVGICHGASGGDGRSAGSSADRRRGSPPPEREAGRQQAGESATHGGDGSRLSAETVDHDVSEVRSHHASCPVCGSSEIYTGITLDPMMGSGTTLAVANRLGRDAIGYDIRQSQVDLTMERLHDGRDAGDG
jgi:hypothetical protein